MVSDSFSKHLLNSVFLLGISFLWLSLALFILILLMRFNLIRQENRHQKMVEVWTPILELCLHGQWPEAVLKVGSRDLLTFLSLWSGYAESVDSEGLQILRLVAIYAGVEPLLPKAFWKGNVRIRIVIINVFGLLADRNTWSLCKNFLNDSNPLLSLAAARSMLRMDAERALPLVLKAIDSHRSWPVARTSLMLLEAGKELISAPIIEKLQTVEPTRLVDWIPYLEIVSPTEALPTLKQLLETYFNQVQIAQATLKVIGKFPKVDIREELQPYLSHVNPLLRADALTAFKKNLQESDKAFLFRMLEQETEPFVQFKTIEALLRLPGNIRLELEDFQKRSNNPDITRIITRLVIEKGLPR